VRDQAPALLTKAAACPLHPLPPHRPSIPCTFSKSPQTSELHPPLSATYPFGLISRCLLQFFQAPPQPSERPWLSCRSAHTSAAGPSSRPTPSCQNMSA